MKYASIDRSRKPNIPLAMQMHFALEECCHGNPCCDGNAVDGACPQLELFARGSIHDPSAERSATVGAAVDVRDCARDQLHWDRWRE
eukprot:7381627-Prymnesium_polylepis.1